MPPQGPDARGGRDLLGGRPTWVGIEPASRTAVFRAHTADRKAATWEKPRAPFDRREFVVSDAATGIAKAVTQVALARRDDPKAPTLEHGLDVFHTTLEAQRVLARHWRRAEAAWAKAEAADTAVIHSKRQGIDARGVTRTARAAWLQAIASLGPTERGEAAWLRAHAALDRFGADGRLHDRGHAAVEIAEALQGRTGPEWSKVRNFLSDPRSLKFLDRMNRRREEAEPRPRWREARAWRWWLRHGRVPACDPLTRLVRAVGRDRVWNESERASDDRVSAVLRSTFRSRGAVACMNSVPRMRPSRHRRRTQPRLDRKRLSWNCHRFRRGPRKKARRYQALNLEWPTYDFWTLLQADPEELTQRLSTTRNAE